jgi:multimeric flavodoxin WrbA
MLNKLKEKMEQLRNSAEQGAATIIVDKVSAEVQEYRYNICQGCEKLYKPTSTCKMCGCFMGVKTWMPSKECPLKKWSTAEAVK